MMTAPAARSLSTSQESCAAKPESSRYARTPQLVGAPARSKQSFTEMGSPHSAPRPSPKGPPSPRGGGAGQGEQFAGEGLVGGEELDDLLDFGPAPFVRVGQGEEAH